MNGHFEKNPGSLFGIGTAIFRKRRAVTEALKRRFKDLETQYALAGPFGPAPPIKANDCPMKIAQVGVAMATDRNRCTAEFYFLVSASG